jgi:rod shape-determining protein MreC
MEATIFNRYRSYRSLVVLVIVVMAQLLYLAYQVKTGRDERLIRVWAVSAVTPFSGIFEAIRRNTVGFMKDYFFLLDVREQNSKLQADNDKLRMENVFYRNQLATAENAHALTIFQAKTPSRTVAARVIGDSTVATAKAVFIDRGSTSNIEKGMAVVTPNGIVGKVVAVYPIASQVLLVTDSTFKVGVESQRGHVHGTLDCGSGTCDVEQIQNEEDVAVGEAFFTSGEDRVFPRGFPVGTVVSVSPGNGMKDVRLNLSGSPGSVEEVLVVLDGFHQPIPVGAVPDEKMAPPLPPPPPDAKETAGVPTGNGQTEADRTLQKYQELGKEQGHVYGAMYSNMPNFVTKPAPKPPAASTPALKGTAATPATPAASGPAVLGAPVKHSPAAAGAGFVTSTHRPIPHPVGPKPALPLGSPRPKPTESTNTKPVGKSPAITQPQ